MEYLTLQNGHLLTIMIPISLIIGKVFMFLRLYVGNKRSEKSFSIGCVTFTTITTILFYILEYEIYFCFIWFGSIVVSALMYNLIGRAQKKLIQKS